MKLPNHSTLALRVFLGLAVAAPGYAQVIPGPADASRIKPEERLITAPSLLQQPAEAPTLAPPSEAPAGAEQIEFVLKDVRITGVTALKRADLAPIYAEQIGKTVTLDFAWKIAEEVTRRYRDAGYFLSRAYVPGQKVNDGVIIIRVVEGYIGAVELDGDTAHRSAVAPLIAGLKAQRPLKDRYMESFLLRLNDLPGLSFRAVLTPPKNDEIDDGAVTLNLVPSDTGGQGSITFDNAGSRFLGPEELSVAYKRSFLPMQETSVSVLSSLDSDEIRYGSFNHHAAIAPNLTLDVFGGMTRGQPGYTLEPLDIESDSKSLGFGLNYQWLRQRDQNLLVKLLLDGRNSSTDIVSSTLTEDHIRALRAAAQYEVLDGWNGVNSASVTLSHGLDALGSSKSGDSNLSRAGARPDFTKAEVSLSRLQPIDDAWSLMGTAMGQASPNVLYSAEEFGFGGQAFGRAYDASELTGNQGVAGSVELRYRGWSYGEDVSFRPYAFYDIGVVWNEANNQPGENSASSAGFGMRVSTSIALSGNIGLAFPLTREVGTPLYGNSGSDPRLLISISQGF